jgi:dienelactone hydrolase
MFAIAFAIALTLWTPPDRGAHPVGYRVITEVDAGRSLRDDAGKVIPRSVVIDVWYPAAKQGAAMRYGDYVIASGRTRTDAPDAFDKRMWATSDAQPAKGRFPLVVYAHTDPDQKCFIAEYLASHGYIVASPRTLGTYSKDLDVAMSGVETQTRDLELTIARMSAMPNVDSTRVSAAGMSFGALSAVALAMRNPAIRAVVSLDGGIGSTSNVQNFGFARAPYHSIARLTAPLLHLYGSSVAGTDLSYLRSLDYSCRKLVGFPSMQHADFGGTAALRGDADFNTVVRMVREFLDAPNRFEAANAEKICSPPKDLFTFHDNFWLNLHHFTRMVARGEPAPGDLTADERAAWDAGVAFYKARYVNRDLLFDDGMVEIKNALLPYEGKEHLDGAAIDAELRAMLERIAPVYRKYWWPKHRAANESWIAEAQVLAREYGKGISERVAAAYGTQWPAQPIPIDLSVTAGPNGAYTSTRPTHTVIAPGAFRGRTILEMLFHEPSHQWGTILQRPIAHAADARNKKVPPQLWHAVLFYNAGELTRRAYAERGIEYVEFAQRLNVYKDLCGDGCRDRIAAAWNRRLSGEQSVDEALDALVASLP